MTATSRQVLFRQEPRGLPTPADFEIAEAPLPDLEDGQFLVSNLYLSLDPYMRMLMGGGWMFRGSAMTPGQVMVGRTVAVVQESRHGDFEPGQHLVGSYGWQSHAIGDGSEVDFRVTPREDVPLSAYLGACGNSGLTAWVGLKIIAETQPGETVLVSAAGGSVGSVAGQIAKAMGCPAIGIAGGAEKCRILTEEFGFDGACDYTQGDLGGQIRAQASEGVDVYFDNVGGETLDAALACLNRLGRVAVCGVLSQYNAEDTPYGLKNTRLIFDRQLTLRGFLTGQHRERWDEGRAELEDLFVSGRLRARETVADGLDSAPEAFIGMLQGRNVGKQVVRLD